MLEITRERIYGGFAGSNKHVYRARIGRSDVASGDTRTEATANAWKQIEASLNCRAAAVYSAIATDGTVITCREYQTDCYELAFHRAKSGTDRDGVLRSGGCEMGKLEIDGHSVPVSDMLSMRLRQYNEACAPVRATCDCGYHFKDECSEVKA